MISGIWALEQLAADPLFYRQIVFSDDFLFENMDDSEPATIDALEASIVRVIREIRPAALEKVAQNWTSRMRFVKNTAAVMPEIIFKST